MEYIVKPINETELAFCNGNTCDTFNCGRYSYDTCHPKDISVEIPIPAGKK